MQKRNSLRVLGLTVVLLASGTSIVLAQSSDMKNMSGMSMSSPEPVGTAAVKAGDLDITGGYVRAMLPGQPVGGGYVTIHNGGSSEERLVSVSSPTAAKVELHEMTMKDNIMRMRELKDGIVIAPGATVVLSPNTLHMMFKQVRAPFRQGGIVPVMLTFEKAGAVSMSLPVEAARGN